MSRENSVFVVGDRWLDKRRDGASSDIWQIARYSEKSRSVVYSSTKCRGLEDAKAIILARVAESRAQAPQTAEEAQVAPLLFAYWREHGINAINAITIAGSLRHFLAFLTQGIGATVTVAALNLEAFEDFKKWRMKPHAYSIPWGGRMFDVDSQGVTGETVQRNLNDIRAALNYAVAHGRIPYAPKVPGVRSELRSPPRDARLSMDQLGAALGYASTRDKHGNLMDPGLLRWLQVMIATAARPDTCNYLDPKLQWQGDLLDMQHPSRPRTKKRNPVVPVIKPLRTVLEAWDYEPKLRVASRIRAFRTMRRALGWPTDIVPKTIRHTIATQLRQRGVPFEDQIRPLLGHSAETGVTAVYAKYDPSYLAKASVALTRIYNEAMENASKWSADQQRTKVGNGLTIVVDTTKDKAQIH